MIKTSDGTQVKRTSGIGDRQPLLGGRKLRALYTATGGETSINLSLLTPAISYVPGNNQISVKRSSGGNPISGLDFFELTSSSIGFPISDSLLAGEIVEIVLDFAATGVMACTPRPDVYTGVGTAGQTLITANFSWPYNLNSGSGIGAVKLIIEGIIQTRGSENDYTEVNLSTANTNQLLLAVALIGGEKIAILPTYQMIDQSAAASTFYGQAYSGMQNAFGAGTQAFIDQSTLISVPNTTIIGRAPIPDLANDLRPSLGIERIPTQQLIPIQNEFGPNGEPVSGILNDDRGLIRFVGTWTQQNNSYGVYAGSDSSGYLEISFYGTALNVLTLNDAVRNYMVSIDGGSETGPYWPTGASGILGNRNYVANQIVNVASGLTLGLHTAKIRAGAVNMVIMGFEILNVNTSGLININPGTAYKNGTKYTNTLVDSVAYGTGVTGTKGGRVVRYMNADGSMGQAFNAVDASPAYLASASHTNEEVARTYNWREFGSARYSANDDFSLLSSGVSNRQFNLDDGTTNLVGNQIQTYMATTWNYDVVMTSAVGSFLTLTFIGTGLDIFMCSHNGTTGVTGSQSIFIDGTSIYTGTIAIGSAKIMKIASGLTYGTHTVKFLVNAGGGAGDVGFIKFITYQPLKPNISASGIEVADYNVLGNLVQNTTAGLETISTGIMRKHAGREVIYVNGTGGTYDWQFGVGEGPLSTIANGRAQTDRLNAYFEYTFFGTGFEFRGRCRSDTSANILVTINSLAATTTNYPSITAWTYGTGIQYSGLSGASITPTTNVFDCADATSQSGVGMGIKGLPLGRYTVRFTNNASGNVFFETLDIITPIHSYKSNLYADIQNTLPVGSQSLMDSRKTSMIKEALPGTKAWVQAVGVNGNPTTTSNNPIPYPDMSVTIKTNGSPIELSFSTSCRHPSNDASIWFRFNIDGVDMGLLKTVYTSGFGGIIFACSDSGIMPVSAGVHKVDVYWWTSGGTATGYGTMRNLTVKEI